MGAEVVKESHLPGGAAEGHQVLTQEADPHRGSVRRLERDSLSGDVTVGPNCGQELYDVVEVTDPRAGLTAAKRRVAGLRLEFRWSGEPRYLQRVTLGAV